jgi:hypothetical protein
MGINGHMNITSVRGRHQAEDAKISGPVASEVIAAHMIARMLIVRFHRASSH